VLVEKGREGGRRETVRSGIEGERREVGKREREGRREGRDAVGGRSV